MDGSEIAVEAFRLLFVPSLTALVVHKLGRARTRRDAICRCCDETLQLLRIVDDAARVYWMASFPQPAAGVRHSDAAAGEAVLLSRLKDLGGRVADLYQRLSMTGDRERGELLRRGRALKKSITGGTFGSHTQGLSPMDPILDGIRESVAQLEACLRSVRRRGEK